MSGPVALGGIITLSAEYRVVVTGELVDPTSPLLELLEPGGASFAAGLIPTRTGLGEYEYEFAVPDDAPVGTWLARWTGIINAEGAVADEAFDVVVLDVPWTATVDGVRGYLPNRLISATSTPNESQVEGFLAVAGNWISSRLGDLGVYTPSTIVKVSATAKGLAEMGAAALTENAQFPERAGQAGSAYGDWLWTQFLHGIDELLESLNKPTEETGGGQVETPVGDVPAFSMPDPTFYRDTGF